MRALLLVGRSGTGKTALLELALRELHRRGIRALACKCSHHDLADDAGSDSDRLAHAGASGVALIGRRGLHLFHHRLELEELLPILAARYEVALVEGGKSSTLPKVELVADEPALLRPDQVVAYLPRGDDPADLRPARLFLDLLEREGAEIHPVKG